jgi:hypothetical protein
VRQGCSVLRQACNDEAHVTVARQIPAAVHLPIVIIQHGRSRAGRHGDGGLFPMTSDTYNCLWPVHWVDSKGMIQFGAGNISIVVPATSPAYQAYLSGTFCAAPRRKFATDAWDWSPRIGMGPPVITKSMMLRVSAMLEPSSGNAARLHTHLRGSQTWLAAASWFQQGQWRTECSVSDTSKCSGKEQMWRGDAVGRSVQDCRNGAMEQKQKINPRGVTFVLPYLSMTPPSHPASNPCATLSA